MCVDLLSYCFRTVQARIGALGRHQTTLYLLQFLMFQGLLVKIQVTDSTDLGFFTVISWFFR